MKQIIEIQEGCAIVNPIRKGAETFADLTCEHENKLDRFDAAAEQVKQNVADQLAAERAKIAAELEPEPNNEEEE